MGSFQLAIFILYYLQVVYALAQSSNDLGGSFVQQDPATGQSDISGVNGLAPQQEGALGAALSSLDQSNAPLPQASTNTDNAFLDPVNETPGAYGLDSVGTRDPNLVAANTDDCASANQPAAGKLKARGGKQRRAPPNPKSVCPTTGGLLPANRKPQAPSGVQQLDPNIWPNVLKVPTKDGDNPACYEATHGLMPIGVCENPLQNPRASEFDPLNTVNPNLIPRAWKLKDCSLGAFPPSFPVFLFQVQFTHKLV